LHTQTLFRPPQRRHRLQRLFSQFTLQPRQPEILKATTSAATFSSTDGALLSTKLPPKATTNVLPTQDMLGGRLLWGGCLSTVTVVVVVVVVATLLLPWFSTKPPRCRGMPLHSITLVAFTLQQPNHHPHQHQHRHQHHHQHQHQHHHQHHFLFRQCLLLHAIPSSNPKCPSF
jgi:hypothetical protein